MSKEKKKLEYEQGLKKLPHIKRIIFSCETPRQLKTCFVFINFVSEKTLKEAVFSTIEKQMHFLCGKNGLQLRNFFPEE